MLTALSNETLKMSCLLFPQCPIIWAEVMFQSHQGGKIYTRGNNASEMRCGLKTKQNHLRH